MTYADERDRLVTVGWSTKSLELRRDIHTSHRDSQLSHRDTHLSRRGIQLSHMCFKLPF